MKNIFQRLFQPHQTAIVHNKHVILIEKSWRTTNVYFDDARMAMVSQDSQMYPTKWRFAYVAEEKRKKVTYSVLLSKRGGGYSIKVEKFSGDCSFQWNHEIGELIYYRK